MQKALLHHFDWKANPCFFNSGLLKWESDLLVISAAGYMTEVEIKTNWADWKNDPQKDKWASTRKSNTGSGLRSSRTQFQRCCMINTACRRAFRLLLG
jgi:hypothetical protein